MDTAPAPTVIAAFASEATASRPLVTYYDDATGERTELSGATLANWVAKTANLLVDGLGLGPGNVAAVALPAHWQAAAVLLGCWSAGLAVDLARPTPTPTAPTPPAPTTPSGGVGPARGAVAFASADRLDLVRADETYALALAPLALGFRPGPPPGTLDYSLEVRGHGDHFGPASPVRPDTAALAGPSAAAHGATHADLVTAARAYSPGLKAGGRLLIDGDARPDPLDWLVAPLLAGATVVLCRNLDPARLDARLAAERATLS